LETDTIDMDGGPGDITIAGTLSADTVEANNINLGGTAIQIVIDDVNDYIVLGPNAEIILDGPNARITVGLNAKIILDGDAEQIYINDGTWANAGIQLDYNAGTPRVYIGDGANQFFKFEGINLYISTANMWLNATSSDQHLAFENTTFGQSGVQIQYNTFADKGRIYAGDGADKFFEFDGTNFSWKASNSALDESGNLTATSATISGTITASAGTIGGWTLSASQIYSTYVWLTSGVSNPGLHIGSQTYGNSGIQLEFYTFPEPDVARLYAGDGSNEYLKWDGTNLSWKGANTALDTAGNLTATSATITGAITATSGDIGGWTIDAAQIHATYVWLTAGVSNPGLHIGSQTYGNAGIQLEYYTFPEPDVARLYAGDGSNEYFKWDGTNLSWKGANTELTTAGNLTCTGGTIGGFTLAATTLTATNLILDSGNQRIKLGTGNDIITMDAADATYRLAIGHATYGSAPFRVTKAGALVASSATITGAITATSGDIGGWTVDAAQIHATYVWLTAGVSNPGLHIGSQTYGNAGIQLEFYTFPEPDVARLYAGDGANNFFKFDGTDLLISSGSTDALVIKSGGNIKIEDGGDLVLDSDSGTTSKIIINTDTTVIEHAMVHDSDEYRIFPSTGTPLLSIGYDLAGAVAHFGNIEMLAGNRIEIRAEEIGVVTDYASMWVDCLSGFLNNHPSCGLEAYTSATRGFGVSGISDAGPTIGASYGKLWADWDTDWQAWVFVQASDGVGAGNPVGDYSLVQIIAQIDAATSSSILLGADADPLIAITADFDGTKMSQISMSADTTAMALDIIVDYDGTKMALIDMDASAAATSLNIRSEFAANQYSRIDMTGSTSAQIVAQASFGANTYANLWVYGDSTPRILLDVQFSATVDGYISIYGNTTPYIHFHVATAADTGYLNLYPTYFEVSKEIRAKTIIKVETMKRGATQAAAGVVDDELWATDGHATLPDHVVMIGTGV